MRVALYALVAGLTLLACGQSDKDEIDASGIIAFDTTRVVLESGKDTFPILAQVARTEEQRTMGLMERRALADTAGMLFIYTADQPDSAGFWMFRTRIPLDIAFADSTGRIVAVRQMVPCEAQLAAGCPSYEPGQPYRVALEVSAGGLSRRGVGVGARIRTSELPASAHK